LPRKHSACCPPRCDNSPSDTQRGPRRTQAPSASAGTAPSASAGTAPSASAGTAPSLALRACSPAPASSRTLELGERHTGETDTLVALGVDKLPVVQQSPPSGTDGLK